MSGDIQGIIFYLIKCYIIYMCIMLYDVIHCSGIVTGGTNTPFAEIYHAVHNCSFELLHTLQLSVRRRSDHQLCFKIFIQSFWYLAWMSTTKLPKNYGIRILDFLLPNLNVFSFIKNRSKLGLLEVLEYFFTSFYCVTMTFGIHVYQGTFMCI